MATDAPQAAPPPSSETSSETAAVRSAQATHPAASAGTVPPSPAEPAPAEPAPAEPAPAEPAPVEPAPAASSAARQDTSDDEAHEAATDPTGTGTADPNGRGRVAALVGAEGVPHIRRPVAPPVAFEPEVPETDDLGEGLPPRRPVRRPRRPRSRLCRWTINLFKALFTLATLAVLGVAGWVAWVTRDLPSVATLRAYEPSEVTHVYASDGTLLGEIYEERRYVLPLNKIPQHVQDAFIAAEDARFWEHSGIDAEGILRALGRNVAAGRVAQGGSTITQQIAKVFLLNSDRALSRKVREALLSWRIERTYTKEHILYLYLNEIFLGSQSYGVEAASRTFFGKHVQEITLAEAAILAGLPPRPSAYNPRADFEAALERQRYVLGQMVKNEFVTQEEANAALAQPIQLATEDNLFLEQAPIFTEYARRYLVEHYGEDRAKRGGLTVFTTVDMGLQRKAEKAIADRVGRWDENFGVRREDIEHLDDDAAIETWRKTKQKALVQRWYDTHDPSKRQSPKPDEALVAMGEQVEAVVLDVKSGTLRAAVGDLEFTIPIKWADFAYPAKGTQIFSRQTSRANFTTQVDDDDDGKYDGTLFRRGDIIQAEIATLPAAATPNGTASGTKKAPPSTSATAKLRQKAGLHAALYSLDLPTGAVRVMVGGADDFRLSQLNRAVQAYRQVGSTFKPLVYAAALQSRMLSVSSNVPDAPIVIRNPKTHTVYRPGNYAGGFSGDTNMVMALAKSRNLSAVWTYQHIDPYADTDLVYNFVRGLGVGGPPLHHMPANVGERPETNHLCRWVDAKNPDAVACQTPLVPGKGQTAHGAAPTGQACRMCDITVGLGSASLTPAEMTTAYATFANGGIYLDPYIIEEVRDRNGNVLEKHRPEPPYQVMAPEVATIMTWLLQKVVTQGTARLASSLGVDVAGKTGTTNDWRDAWFIGYTPDVVTTVWVGFDQPRTMAQSATGGHTALPLWVDYMKNVADRSRGRSFPVWGNVVWEGNMPYINGVMPNIDPLELLYPGEAPKPKEPVQRIITAPAVPEISEVGTDL